MNITGAIFDFDGTLFDSMHCWKGIKDKFIVRMGLTLTKEDEEVFKGKFLKEFLLLAVERFELKESYDELLGIFFDFLKEIYFAEAQPKNDIKEFLELLYSKGVKMGIATASGESAVIAMLEKYGMEKYFSAIYSTYTVGAPKTEPKVYDVVLEKLGTSKSSTWVFEDALYAASTAKNSGYKVVGIYDISEGEPEKLKALADKYIYNFSDPELHKQ